MRPAVTGCSSPSRSTPVTGWWRPARRRASAAPTLEHFLAWRRRLAPRYRDGGQVDALARIDAEHPNLTAAIERCLAAGTARRPAGSAGHCGCTGGCAATTRSGVGSAEAALAHDLPDDVRPRAELAAATMAFAMDDVRRPPALVAAAEAHTPGDDRRAMANAVAGVGLADLAAGDLAAAAAQLRRARDRSPSGRRGRGVDRWRSPWIWSGTVALLLGDADAAVDPHRARPGLGAPPR